MTERSHSLKYFWCNTVLPIPESLTLFQFRHLAHLPTMASYPSPSEDNKNGLQSIATMENSFQNSRLSMDVIQMNVFSTL